MDIGDTLPCDGFFFLFRASGDPPLCTFDVVTGHYWATRASVENEGFHVVAALATRKWARPKPISFVDVLCACANRIRNVRVEATIGRRLYVPLPE